MQIHWLYEHSEHWIGFTILDPCSAFHLDTDWTTRQVQPNSCRLLLLPLSKALNRKKTAQNVHCFFKAKFQKRHFILHQLEVLEVSQLQLKGGGFTLTGWADGAARCYYTGGAVKTKPVTCLSMRLSAGSASPTWQQDWDLRCSAFSGAALFQNRRDGWHGSRGLVHIRNPPSPSRASSERHSSRPCDRGRRPQRETNAAVKTSVFFVIAPLQPVFTAARSDDRLKPSQLCGSMSLCSQEEADDVMRRST